MHEIQYRFYIIEDILYKRMYLRQWERRGFTTMGFSWPVWPIGAHLPEEMRRNTAQLLRGWWKYKYKYKIKEQEGRGVLGFTRYLFFCFRCRLHLGQFWRQHCISGLMYFWTGWAKDDFGNNNGTGGRTNNGESWPMGPGWLQEQDPEWVRRKI